MSDQPRQPESEHSDDALLTKPLPKALVDDLSAYADAGIDVDEQVDMRILADARQRLAELRESQAASAGEPPRTLAWPTWATRAMAGVAAAVLIGVTVWMYSNVMYDRGPSVDEGDPNATASVRGDLDGDGVVTVVDAMLMERWVRGGRVAALSSDDQSQGGHDYNGDGKVDANDAAMLASWAVAVVREDEL